MRYRFILMDGTALLFRAYFSMLRQNLQNDEGFPTGAIFGVLRDVKKIQKDYPDAQTVMVFDAEGKNFRHEIYPDYKAHRKPADEELIMQIEPLYEIIRALGLPFFCVSGVEADDVIATLATRLSTEKTPVLIVSNDKDLNQLISKNIAQLTTKGDLLDERSIVEKTGLRPDQVMDFLALAGDSSDNIPGIPGVGDKTALRWLLEYRNIAGVKKNAALIAGKIGEKLRENFAALDLSYELVRLKKDVDIVWDFLDQPPKIDVAKLRGLYQKYGFRNWLKELVENFPDLQNDAAAKNPAVDGEKKLVLTSADFSALVDILKKSTMFVFDLETTSLDYMDAEIVGLAFLVGQKSYYLPVAHRFENAPNQLGRDAVLAALRPIFENPKQAKIGQNLKYDMHVLKNHRIVLRGIFDDTMLRSYCWNANAVRHNLDDLAAHYLNHRTIHFDDVAPDGHFERVSLENALLYAAEDVEITEALNRLFEQKMQAVPALLKLYRELEMPLVSILMKMERGGVLIDTEILAEQQKKINRRMEKISKRAFEIAGESFNLDSPKQVRAILFAKIGLRPQRKTPSGQASTNEAALRQLDHPLVDLLLEYRLLAKLDTTYLAALPKQIHPKTGRLHTSYHQATTATGRLSSSKPNLQNIPIRSEEGGQIREAFIAADGRVILAADYSQIELRIMAHISQDKNLLEAFAQNLDIHAKTASEVFQIPLAEVDKNQRRDAKAINFGLIYGMGAFSLARQINVSRTEAKRYIDAYFENYPGVEKYMQTAPETAEKNGYVETIVGRRIYVPDINSKNHNRRQHARRLAINAPMQGSSADIIKRAMIEIDRWMVENNDDDLKMMMQVHDELVFEAPVERAEIYAKRIKILMSTAAKISVPLAVDVGIGKTWQSARG